MTITASIVGRGIYLMITIFHDMRCPQKIVPCPNEGCDKKMKRQEIRKHVEECPYTKREHRM